MTLNDCTKAELLEILAVISMDAGTSWNIRRALSDIELRRIEKTHAEAAKVAAVAKAKQDEYIELLAPYEGKPLGSVPLDVIEKARHALRESREADAKWMKLLGIEVKK